MIDTTGGINKQEFTNPYEFFKWLASFWLGFEIGILFKL
jgi:hypothetical protein